MCAIYLIVIYLTATSAIKILSPPSLTKYVNAPSFTKFSGPQSLPPTNGTAIFFRANECGSIQKNYEGYVVFIPAVAGCFEQVVHKNFDTTNPVAVVIADTFVVPGYAHNLKFGDPKETRLQKSPMLHAYEGDLTELIDYMSRPDYAEDVIVEISLPDKNYYLDVFDSVEYFVIVRVFLPSLEFPTGIYAFYLFWVNFTGKKTTMTTAKNVIFFLEGVVMIADAVGLAVGGLASTENFSIYEFVFFMTGFPGTEMFCSVIVALFFKSLNYANKNFVDVVDIFRNRKIFMTILFLFFIILDTLPALFTAFGSSALVVLVVAACISIIAVLVIVFVIFEKRKFYVESRSKANKIKGTASSNAILAVCEHTAKWMIPNVTFIFLGIITTILLASPLFTTPEGFFSVLAMIHFFRWGTVISQLIALKWKYNPNKEQKRSIPRWLWTGKSDNEREDAAQIQLSNTEPTVSV
eukprot:c22001_g1_i4.p1 GENE.c22001_g1_i4~~c22001_g1_i4.p1  ORF type:complete len:477 (-),score=119.52 c22001_g1_i4:76-1473(-)